MFPTRYRRRNWLEPSAPRTDYHPIDRMLKYQWGDDGDLDEYGAGSYHVDIHEDEKAFYVEAEMPGFKKEEIEVNLEQGMLRITAERKPVEKKNRRLSERRYTRVERAFNLPGPVDESKVSARIDSGVLHIEVPKSGKETARRIEVK